MNQAPLLIASAVFLVMVAIMAFKTGWEAHKSRATPITIQSIEEYIESTFPDLWAAYKKGVSEGYEQGLRDGQEDPSEPA